MGTTSDAGSAFWDSRLSSLLRKFRKATAADYIRVYVSFSEESGFVLVHAEPASDGDAVGSVPSPLSLDNDGAILERVLAGEVVMLPPPPERPGRTSEDPGEGGGRAMPLRRVLIPLQSQQGVIGLLDVGAPAPVVTAPMAVSLLAVVGEALTAALQVCRDHADLASAYDALVDRAQVRSQELDRRRLVAEGLRDILIALNSDRTLAEILNYLVVRACALMASDACILYRLDRERDSVAIEASAGFPGDLALATEFPLVDELSVGVPGLDRMILAQRPQIQVVPAVAEAEPESPPSAAQAWLRAVAHRFHAVLSVPLVVKGDYYGVLGFYYAAPRRFTEAEISLAESFGSQAALAIENANLRIQAEHAAVLQERGRLARDLHDSVTQSLYSLTLLAEAARRLAAAGDLAQVQEAIHRLGDIGQQALKEMRLLVYELRPSLLRREGLLRALAQRLETVEKRAGVDTQLLVMGHVVLPPALEEQLYHVVQEALNNALKHAAATSVTVNISGNERAVVVEIADNGRGFDPEALEDGGGIGLTSMRERVESMGGELSLQAAPGAGTQVTIALELPQPHEGETR